jgi:hypothetical protein
MHFRVLTAALVGGAIATLPLASAHAEEVEGYGFPAAAQEITQLFWLAETASACGWASADDASRFQQFSMRFLGAHLSDGNRHALMALVAAEGYADKVREAAREGASQNCASNRWRLGWLSYKAAADENEQAYSATALQR